MRTYSRVGLSWSGMGRQRTHPTQARSHAGESSSDEMLGALLGGAVAAAACGLTMLLLRSAVQVRTLPERLLEWLLLYVPLDLFEKGLQQFGFDAKRYALYATTMVLLAAVTALAAAVLIRRWSNVRLLAL